jgi:hypothetical protein
MEEAKRQIFKRTPRRFSFFSTYPFRETALAFSNPLPAPFPSYQPSTTTPQARFPCPQTLAPAMDGDGAGGTAAVHHNAHSPEDVFRDFRARRVGIVKALTTGQLS